MGRPTFSITDLLSAPDLRPQYWKAFCELRSNLDPALAYRVCDIWQRRFERALRSEIPDWVGMAGFRLTKDVTISRKNLPGAPECLGNPCVRPISTVVSTVEDLWSVYRRYFEDKEELNSGKLQLADPVQAELLKQHRSPGQLGGQAGNIAWLWHCVGADPVVSSPYVAQDLLELPGVNEMRFLQFESNCGKIDRLAAADLGIPDKSGNPAKSPAGGSIVIAEGGRRLILGIQGLRSTEPRSWNQVRFIGPDGKKLHDKPLDQPEGQDKSWPWLPFFCTCNIDNNTLCVHLISEENIHQATTGKIDFAVIGAIDGVFVDPWVRQDRVLQLRLLAVAERQLSALAKAGVRIGMEMSRVPSREYLKLVARLCGKEVVVALGINGIDELPGLVGEMARNNCLTDLWLDPMTMPPDLQEEAAKEKQQGDSFGCHFEYVTYCRAKRLAESTGARTLYVHTTTLDFVLRRDADPGALLHAQMGDAMGKGLVLGALLQRAHRDKWHHDPQWKVAPSVTPEAMVRLATFAKDFASHEPLHELADGVRERLLRSGLWLAPSAHQHSVAVVPVLWPTLDPLQTEDAPFKNINTTGSGDMSFGAFVLLGGV